MRFKKMGLMLFALILAFLPALPSFAYKGGLLEGKSIEFYKSGVGTSNRLEVTDNKTSTGIIMTTYDKLTYNFSSPVDIESYSFLGSETSPYVSVSIFDDSGKRIYSRSPAYIDGRPVSIYGSVSKIEISYNGPGEYTVYEFDVYKLVDITPPGEVNGIQQSSTDVEVNLKWNNPADLDLAGTKIYRDGQFISTLNKNINSFKDTEGLQPSTPYLYKITTFDVSGNESSGVTVSVSTLTEGWDYVSDVTNVQTTVFDDRVKITWENPPEDSVFIEVQIFKEGVLHAVATTPATSFIDFDLQPKTEYSYLMRSKSVSGYMSPGVKVTATTTGAPEPPRYFYGNPGNGEVTLDWDGTESKRDYNFVGFHIYQDGTRITTEPIKEETYTVSGLKNDQTYTFEVSAIDDLNNESTKTNEITLKPEFRGIPEKPNVRYQAQHNKITLQWDSVPFANHYEIYKESGGEVSFIEKLVFDTAYAAEEMVGSTAGTSYEIEQDPETTATYSIVAVNELGSSPPATIQATTLGQPISIDLTTNTNFTASDVFQSGVSLASNFWPFLLLGLTFVVAPWIYFMVAKASKAGKENESVTSSRGEGRELNRKIRLQLRKEEQNG